MEARQHTALSVSSIGDRPKALIEALSESLLETFRRHFRIERPLIDPYDVYQHLMDYWVETMQDDVYMLVHEGWNAVQDGKPNTELIPSVAYHRSLLRFGAGSNRGLRSGARRDRPRARGVGGGAYRRGWIAGGREDRQRETNGEKCQGTSEDDKADTEASDERRLLEQVLALIDREAAAGKKVKDAQKALDAKVVAKYGQLSEGEIKTLVVEDKWLAALAATVQNELGRVSQALTARIRQLAGRYATPLPDLVEEVDALTACVERHLEHMGLVWK